MKERGTVYLSGPDNGHARNDKSGLAVLAPSVLPQEATR